MGTTMSLYSLALELTAFFGFLCLLLNVLRFVLVDVPHEWKKWQLHRSQQRELRRLQRRVDALTRRKLADEQETRRRARASSVKKRRQEGETPQQAVDGRLHPIADLVHSEGQRPRSKEWAARDSKQRQTPQQQRQRLSIYSTAKKPASSMRERRRARDEEEL